MVQPSSDFSHEKFEQDQLELLRGSFLGGWHTDDGSTRPFISGVSFDAVDLRGTFPDSSIVALFHASDYPGIQFGRRWKLYDEQGKPEDLDYIDVHLMEDIESANGGLPPPGQCRPDSDGVVWF
jgi:hypothetical protein